VTGIWWYLSRSSGIVATVLIVAALMWGFFFSVASSHPACRAERLARFAGTAD
jgi:hypothetical protein